MKRRKWITPATVSIVLFLIAFVEGCHQKNKSGLSDPKTKTITVSKQVHLSNALTQKEKQHGWKLLFNGKDLKGWHSYQKKKPSKNWKVRNGAIVVVEKHNGGQSDLVTDKEFKNFDLKLEWKMKPCSNSGVKFYIHELPPNKKKYDTGPEMQITDLSCLYTSTHSVISDSRIYLHRAGALYDLVPVDTEWVRPAPKWNKYEIIADSGHLRLFENGHKVVDTHMWDNHWRKLISHTKFKTMPNFGTFRKGHILLQGTEDGKVWFRNIKIKTFK
jgi:hypothetical protein